MKRNNSPSDFAQFENLNNTSILSSSLGQIKTNNSDGGQNPTDCNGSKATLRAHLNDFLNDFDSLRLNDSLSVSSNLKQSNSASMSSIDTCSFDYPFLQKIFQTLFNEMNFVDCAFFEGRNSFKSRKLAKSSLYELMIKQLLFDGYIEVATVLSNAINSSVSLSNLAPTDTLNKMFDILNYIEIRSQTDIKFSNLLDWFLSCNNEIDSIVARNVLNSKNSYMPSSSGPLAESNSAILYKTDSDRQMILPLNDASIGSPQSLQVAYKFGQIGSSPGCLDTPHGFCLGIDNDIVVADTNNHRICVFTLQGNYKFSFGEYGTESGKLHQPRKIAMIPPAILDENNGYSAVFVVCDRGTKRSRMQVFSTEGDFIRLIDIPSMDIVSGLTTTQDRKIIVVDSVRSGVLVMDEYGLLLNWFTCAPHMMEPSDIAVHNKHFYICDFKGHCVSIFNTHGVLINRLFAKLLKFPNGIDVSDHGDIICGDSHGNRFHISVFNSRGKLVGDYDCPFVKVSRCCGLRLSKEGLIVTLAKNNNHAVVMSSITINSPMEEDMNVHLN
ncbi:hypothetical protein NH340_JMT03582 [Sarcoptes scabiei]|nr:hypothetical protein NH340_JMT03582 [Sarcoptes scabiei]